MAFVIEHPWLFAAGAVGIGFSVPVVVFAVDTWSVRRRRQRRGGFLIGGDR